MKAALIKKNNLNSIKYKKRTICKKKTAEKQTLMETQKETGATVVCQEAGVKSSPSNVELVGVCSLSCSDGTEAHVS